MRTARKQPPPSVSQHRREAELESWISTHLNLHDLFAGVTDKATRAARLKVTLLQRNLVEAVAGKFNGELMKYRQAYERLYGEWRDET